MSLLDDQPTTATVRTLSRRRRSCSWARDYFRRLVQALPPLRQYFEDLSTQADALARLSRASADADAWARRRSARLRRVMTMLTPRAALVVRARCWPLVVLLPALALAGPRSGGSFSGRSGFRSGGGLFGRRLATTRAAEQPTDGGGSGVALLLPARLGLGRWLWLRRRRRSVRHADRAGRGRDRRVHADAGGARAAPPARRRRLSALSGLRSTRRRVAGRAGARLPLQACSSRSGARRAAIQDRLAEFAAQGDTRAEAGLAALLQQIGARAPAREGFDPLRGGRGPRTDEPHQRRDGDERRGAGRAVALPGRTRARRRRARGALGRAGRGGQGGAGAGGGHARRRHAHAARQASSAVDRPRKS